MSVSYEGIGYLAVTFPVKNSSANKLCKVNSQGQVENCSDGDHFCGYVVSVEKEYAAVQLEGFVKVSFTGTTPARGYTKLSANNYGGVKVDTNGREYLVVEYSSADSTVTIKL